MPAPEDDDEAAKYEIADERPRRRPATAGTRSATGRAREADRCRHNEGYWTDGNWWGVGPGAHSHVGGVRWWNVKHPNAYAARVSSPGSQPAAGRELLTDDQRYDERVLLGVRLRRRPGRRRACAAAGRSAVAGLIADGLVDGSAGAAPTAGWC